MSTQETYRTVLCSFYVLVDITLFYGMFMIDAWSICFCLYLQIYISWYIDTCDPFYKHGITLITAWISNLMPNKVWDEITYPSLNLNGCSAEVKEWISNVFPHFMIM